MLETRLNAAWSFFYIFLANVILSTLLLAVYQHQKFYKFHFNFSHKEDDEKPSVNNSTRFFYRVWW